MAALISRKALKVEWRFLQGAEILPVDCSISFRLKVSSLPSLLYKWPWNWVKNGGNGEEWEKFEALQKRRLHYLEQNVNRNMDFKHASGDFLEESEEDSRESFYLDSKARFLCIPSQESSCGCYRMWICRLEELWSFNTFCDFLFKLLNICFINVSVCKHVWGSSMVFSEHEAWNESGWFQV